MQYYLLSVNRTKYRTKNEGGFTLTILGEYIKKLRDRVGYSIRKLSEVSGISKSIICEIESGKAKKRPLQMEPQS